MKTFKTRLTLPAAASLLALLTLFCSVPASASQIIYSFSATAGDGSLLLLDPMGSPSDISGVSFTVTGKVVDGVDLTAAGDGIGQFAATSKYDFGSFGIFMTDVGGEAYLQNCAGLASILCVGVTDIAITGGLFAVLPAVIAGDPDVGIPLGTVDITAGSGIFPFLRFNSAGQGIFINGGLLDASITVDLPEPATTALLAVGLLGAGCARRRRAR